MRASRAFLVGIFLAFWYKLDLIALLASLVEMPMTPNAVGFVLTGCGIGRGANWLHQLVSEYFPVKR